MAIKNRLITGANFRDFDWNKAKLFYHIVKCGSFIKAAQIAGTDQPALTRQMQGLEQQLGCPLLIRKPGFGIAITRRGEELYKMVEPFFAEVRGFCGETYVEINGEKKRKIRIAATHALVNHVLSDLIINYAKNNPHVSFELIGDDYSMDITLHDIDIVIQSLDKRFSGKKAEGVEHEYLFTLEKKLYASSSYINTYGEPETVEDLVNHNILAFPQPESDPYYAHINWALTLGMPEGEFHKPIYMSNSIESLVKAAEEGIGIVGSYEEFSVIKKSSLKNILPNIKDQPIKNYFIYPNYLKEDREILSIKNFLMEKLQN